MNLFVEFVQFSIGQKAQLSRKLSTDDWRYLFNESQRQSLLGVFMDGVERLVAMGEPKPSDLMKWIGLVLSIERRNELLDAKAAELTDSLAKDGFRSCVLKGQGYALLYPNPRRRQSGDIDIWVEGSRDKILGYLKRKYTVHNPVIHHVDVEVFDDVPVEVHFIPSYTYNPFRYRKFKKFFAKQAEAQFSNVCKEQGFAYPTMEFNGVYCLMHIFKHVLYEGIGLRQLLDYFYILKNCSDCKNEVWQNIRWMGLDKFAAAVMYVEQTVFGLEDAYLVCPPDEKNGRILLAEIERSGNFGKFDKRNSGVDECNGIVRYLRNLKRNLQVFAFCPSEVLWSPIWKPCHLVWRYCKGYIG